MAYSFTAIPTHSVGDTLPVADYNAIANQINGNAPVFATSGTVTNTTTSGSAPFFCFAGSYNLVTDTNGFITLDNTCLLYTSPSPRDGLLSRMPSSA